MIIRRVLATLAVAVGLGAGTGTVARAQEPAAPKDEALDSLLEKLSEPSDRPDEKSRKTAASAKKDRSGAKKPDRRQRPRSRTAGSRSRTAASPGRPGRRQGRQGPGIEARRPGSSTGKDQEVDELLEEAGRDDGDPVTRTSGRAAVPAAGRSPTDARPAGKPDQPDRSRLSGKDKETDEHLEELTGRKRKKKTDDDERSGPAGQIIKEMRDIEQKLGKPDTGEATREEQKKVVKQHRDADRGDEAVGPVVDGPDGHPPGPEAGPAAAGRPAARIDRGGDGRGAPLQKPHEAHDQAFQRRRQGRSGATCPPRCGRRSRTCSTRSP